MFSSGNVEFVLQLSAAILDARPCFPARPSTRFIRNSAWVCGCIALYSHSFLGRSCRRATQRCPPIMHSVSSNMKPRRPRKPLPEIYSQHCPPILAFDLPPAGVLLQAEHPCPEQVSKEDTWADARGYHLQHEFVPQ